MSPIENNKIFTYMTLEELKRLMQLRENEHLEFKSAKEEYSILGDLSDLSKNRKSILGYCVALGNEGGGKLILGVSDNIPREIVGTSALQDLSDVKSKIFKNLNTRINTQELFDVESRRIVIIDIPSRRIGEPLKFYGIPLMRIGEELTKMDSATETKIRNEIKSDWSASICHNATVKDLDPKAITVAKNNFITKNPKIGREIEKWDTETFLNKAKLTIQGKITNTAIILLGKTESSVLISPAVAQISWILKSDDGVEKDYEHFSTPFLLTVENLFDKIRNLKYRYIKDGSLFPEEVDMYDPYIIREALHNCIAHQDYSLHGRIQVIENEDGYLLFTNVGKFLPGSVENVIESDCPQGYYQNKFLADAMVNLNMIDTIGSGIKKMFNLQKDKFFPLPNYDLSNEKVSVTIYGKVLDLNYAKTLAHHKDLTLLEIMLLDQIQKGRYISKLSAKKLKEKSLIEGRYPNLYISELMAGTTGEMAQYIKNRGFQNEHYKKMLREFLSKKPGASRRDIDGLLISMLPKILSEKQKIKKVDNLLHDLSKIEKTITNKGSTKNPKWEINN